jgi:hypothetical protein
MTKALTAIDRIHRKLMGHKDKYQLRFERELAQARIIIARSEGKPVPDDAAVAVTTTPRCPIKRERLPIKRERLQIMRERLDAAPVLPPPEPVTAQAPVMQAVEPERPECLANVSHSAVGLLNNYVGHAVTSHAAAQYRTLRGLLR